MLFQSFPGTLSSLLEEANEYRPCHVFYVSVSLSHSLQDVLYYSHVIQIASCHSTLASNVIQIIHKATAHTFIKSHILFVFRTAGQKSICVVKVLRPAILTQVFCFRPSSNKR
jgi:hypothetical protein